MRRRSAIALAVLAGVPSVALAQTISDTTVHVSSVASGFSQPTGMAFSGKSSTDFFVIEKATGLVRHSFNGTVSNALDLAVANDSERGLLGITLDPSFSSNHFVYLYYSKASADGGTWQDNQVSRFTWNGSTLGS